MKSKNTNIPLTQPTFVDCGETIKIEDIKGEINEEKSVEDQETENHNILEDIKEEVKEEESVEDPLYIHNQEIENINICIDIKEEGESVHNPLSVSVQEGNKRSENDNICTEVKEEGIYNDTLCVQEIHNFRDEENNTAVDDIDIVEHKIDIQN
jgi:hypothetical protein